MCCILIHRREKRFGILNTKGFFNVLFAQSECFDLLWLISLRTAEKLFFRLKNLIFTFFLTRDMTPIRVRTCWRDSPSRGTPSAKVSAPSAPGSHRCLMKRETYALKTKKHVAEHVRGGILLGLQALAADFKNRQEENFHCLVWTQKEYKVK